MTLSRRVLLQASALGATALASPGLFLGRSFAQTAPDAPANTGSAGKTLHGLSVFNELKYGPDFQNFSYVKADAPKGGRIVFTAPSWQFNQNATTYNTFNSFILKGDAPPRMEMCFDSLMVRALDEPDAIYGLVAESVEISADGKVYTFQLRPEAKFHDGSALKAEDVAFSLTTLKASGHPLISQTIREMDKAEAVDDTHVAVTFTGYQTRQLPLFVAQLPIFSMRYYTRYNFDQSTLTPPLSSGPYRVGAHEVGRYVEYQRVEDWWADDLPVAKGQNNFDVIRIEFFRDRTAAFEGFKKGVLTYQEEFTSKTWATEYNFPAIVEGKVKKTEFPDHTPSGAQGWFFNTRREKFADPRVREAIGYAFDFEWANKSLFYGLYKRTQSFFANSVMEAHGKPSKAELALLDPFKDKLPASVFGDAIKAPVSDGTGFDRKLLREAARLLKEAGCTRDGSTLLTPTGDPFTLEILDNSPAFGRITQPFIGNLERLGIKATSRMVDGAQYQERLNTFDFDICTRRFSMSPTLDDDAWHMWGSQAASTQGSNNLAGINDPVVDALIRTALAAKTREDMDTAAHALDRVLRSGFYWVPHWYKDTHTVAFWDEFGYPDKMPDYAFPIESLWWFDSDKAKAIGQDG